MFTANPNRLKKLYDAELEFSIIGMVNDSGEADLIRDNNRRRIDYGEY